MHSQLDLLSDKRLFVRTGTLPHILVFLIFLGLPLYVLTSDYKMRLGSLLVTKQKRRVGKFVGASHGSKLPHPDSLLEVQLHCLTRQKSRWGVVHPRRLQNEEKPGWAYRRKTLRQLAAKAHCQFTKKMHLGPQRTPWGSVLRLVKY